MPRLAFASRLSIPTAPARPLEPPVNGSSVPIAEETRASVKRFPALEFWFVVAVALAMTLVASHLRSTYLNNYVRLADAIIHGHLWIAWPGPIIDAVAYRGRHYGVDGPFPVIFVLPLVLILATKANLTPAAVPIGGLAICLAWPLFDALRLARPLRRWLAALIFAAAALWFSASQNGGLGDGMSANETAVATVMGTVAVAVFWLLLRRLGVARAPRLWLCLFAFAGTDLWWCAELGDVWFFAHIVAVVMTLSALLECSSKRRGWLIGLLAVCAVESRFTLVFALPLYAFLIATGALRSENAQRQPDYDVRAELRSFGAMLAAGLAVWIGYNEAMWGTVVDIGHSLYYHQDSWGKPDGSPFRLSYLPYQIYSFFMRPPEFVEYRQELQWPYLKVDPNGVALTFTSPALILAFWAPRSRLRTMLWITTALVAAPSFLYYLNGWYQFGMRHALDFEPFLFVLMALAVRSAMPRWAGVLCAYSALAGAWGVWYWSAFFRTGD